MSKAVTPSQAALSTANALRCLACNADEWAWAFIIERHGSRMLRTASLITGDRTLAEDACQEAFLHIRISAERFQPKGDDGEAAATGWIMRIAANSALQLVRSRRRRHQHEQQSREHTASLIKKQLIQSNDDIKAELRSELVNLPEAHRLPLMLHYFSGLDYESIAAEIGCTVGAARMRVHRGIEFLRSRLVRAGCIMTAGAIMSELSSAEAAPIAPMPQLIAHWNELLHSTATPFASSAKILGGITIMTKISIAAAGLAAVGLLGLAISNGIGSDAVSPKPKKYEPRTEQSDKDAQSGTVRGTVTAIQDNGVTIKGKAGNSETYTVNWVGGDPAAGGSLDENMMDKLSTIRVGDVLELNWVWNDRRRISDMKVVEKGTH